MEIYYQGVEITNLVQTRKCIVRDTCGGRCDSLEIEFENAAGWYRWGPQEDDEILVAHNGYDTGRMYLNTVLPEEGRYRILATALPCAARQREYRSFTGKTIEEIMRACGMRTGMEFAVFGIDGKTVIPYIEQENESVAALLYRLLKYEGAALKCMNGKYTAIGIAYAQERDTHETIEIGTTQDGIEYRRSGALYKSVTIRTPYAEATANDVSVSGARPQMTFALPARNDIQAGRWARGVLLDHNRQAETLVLNTEFNAGYSAMTRIDVTGSTDANGEWLVQEAEHDLVNLASKATLRRCIATIQ